MASNNSRHVLCIQYFPLKDILYRFTEHCSLQKPVSPSQSVSFFLYGKILFYFVKIVLLITSGFNGGI